MADTDITSEHKRAFEALKSGRYGNFCLFPASWTENPPRPSPPLPSIRPKAAAARPNTASTRCSSR